MIYQYHEREVIEMKKNYPCDNGSCPYGDGSGMYFCRDNCGLGVDDENDDELIRRQIEEEEAEKRAAQESLGGNWW